MAEVKRKLILLRHAKSDWDGPYNSDFERPLNERGRASAPMIGQYAKDNNHTPDLIYCSPALRTRQTRDLFTSALGQDIETRFPDELYGASTQDLNMLIRTCPDTISTLMIVGHNPGLGALAYTLSPKHADLFGKYPTASFATFSFDKESWHNFDCGPCNFSDFVKPGDLM